MKSSVVAVLALAASAQGARPAFQNVAVDATQLTAPRDMVHDDEFVARLNSMPGATYTAGHNPVFAGWTMDDARKTLGVRLDQENVQVDIPVKTYDDISNDDIPDSFDAREQWGPFIHPVRNQMQCGSCWAFAASEALSDRLAIATAGQTDHVLSPEAMVECDTTDMGCQGGYLQHAWAYLQAQGIPTEDCMPYTSGTGEVEACPAQCTDGSNPTMYKTTDAFQLATVEDIQKAIMTDGPVEGGFSVYKSFMSYQAGVYSHKWWQVWDTIQGGHAIKIVGWGVDDSTASKGEPFWWVQNSWSEQWGLDGFFKIKRGVDECGIESQVFAGHAQI